MPSNNLVKTANGHQTSLLVAQHVPSFVIADHPKFVTFIEKYYEFMANNTVLATANSDVYYYGAGTAAKVLQDINDVDTTDFSEFVESFRRQYGYSFPQELYSESNQATLYKNLVDFYRAVGTEDSFKMLFRLLYNEEIEIYYPMNDVLVASGGDYVKKSRIKVNYVDNLNDIRNKKLVGVSSGASATIEEVKVVKPPSDNFVSGKIANTSIPFSSGVANSEIHDSMKFLEHGSQVAFVYLTDVFGKFQINEEVYYSDGELANTSVAANTIILPLIRKVLLFDQVRYSGANSVVSIYDSRMHNRSNSTFAPWGSSNISYTNTGMWHTTGGGQGEIVMMSNNVSGSMGSRVMQIGNNSVGHANGDMRHFVYSRPIGIHSEDAIYRMSIRARDLGGNSSYSVAAGNRFSAGITALRHDLRRLSGNSYTDTYEDPFWFVSHKQSLDDQFYVYTGYFGGRETELSSSDPYLEKNYGNGGRLDLPSGDTSYNSLQKAINREVLLPFNTTYILPTFKVNEIANGASFSQSVTQIDFISLEEITAIQTQEGNRTGSYRTESSLLSGSSYLQDSHYYQRYAYDIRSKQQLKDYATVVRETVHPAGMKMFGTKITESSANVSLESSQNNLTTPFSPDQFDSLAAWWRADAIGPQNVDYRKYGPDIAANGVYGTEKNRFPVGSSSFEDLFDEYDLNAPSTQVNDVVVEGVTAEGSPASAVGNRSLKITDKHAVSYSNFNWPTIDNRNNTIGQAVNSTEDDDFFSVVIEPYRKWLISFYVMSSNNVVSQAQGDAIRINSTFANNSGGYFHDLGQGGTIGYVGNTYPGISASPSATSYFPPITTEDAWERISMVFDYSLAPFTRVAYRWTLPNRVDQKDTGLSANSVYHFDGFMMEEYVPAEHGTVWGQHTPSPYIVAGMSHSNVISWFDQSPNKHHVYANTEGGFYAPQYIASAVNGKPAVRFSSNSVNNESNNYIYNSIGGTKSQTDVTAGTIRSKPPTSGLQSKITSNSSGGYLGGTLSNPSLARPVTNTWTIMAVVKTNLAINASSYDTSLHPMIINSGYAGNEDALSDSGSALGALNLGYQVIGETGAVQTNVVNASAGLTSVNTAAIATFGTLSSANTDSFRIVGISVNASTLSVSSTEDLLNFHVDGRRFSNSEIHSDLGSFVSGYTGMAWTSQNNYVTSIGKWAPSNNQIWDTSATGVNKVYPHGTADWDGDIAEILTFNEKLSNTNIALVEGYLAHKYGLQENLKHKDDDGNDGPEVKGLEWDFTDASSLGWDIYAIQLYGPGNGLRAASEIILSAGVGLSSGNLHIEVPTLTSVHDTFLHQNTAVQLNTSAYDKFAIRFYTHATKLADAARGRLQWSYVDDSGNFGTGSVQQGYYYTPSPYPASSEIIHEYDLSAHADWKGNITSLTYHLDNDGSGSVEYDIASIYLSGTNHPHPYRYNIPVAVGANSWNTNY
tara:strand:- start:1097 stop:5449 length:4353 start_codon:yes stop_codon:yes gene_type:complete